MIYVSIFSNNCQTFFSYLIFKEFKIMILKKYNIMYVDVCVIKLIQIIILYFKLFF